MIPFIRILVVSNPDVSVLFLTSYSYLFPPSVGIILLVSPSCSSISVTNLAYVTVFVLGLVDFDELH